MTRSEYLQTCITNAKRVLSEPNARYPNGRMSHDHMRDQLVEYEGQLLDCIIDHGRWYADGRFAGFAPGK